MQNPLEYECEIRIERLQLAMRDREINGFLITQNVDLYYFSGSMQTGYLFIPVMGDPIYYVRRSVQRAMSEAVIRTVPLGSFRRFGEQLQIDFPQLFKLNSPHIAMEFDVAPAQLVQRISGLLPQATLVDGSILPREVRMIKSPYEIQAIKEAARVINLALENAIGYIYEGMPEYELIARIEFDIRMNGHIGMMRMRAYNQEIITGVVGAGEAVATPTYFDGPAGGVGLSAASPQGAGHRLFQRDEAIFVDIGCCIEGYVIDQTRTVVMGTVPQDMAAAYEVAARILKNTEQKLRPGTICEDLYKSALEEAEAAGLSAYYMGYGADQVSFLGHGIGLEIDELPVLAHGFVTPLAVGMVIAIEPKFTFPGRGVVGIENTYAITEEGYEKLTISREGIIRIQV
ncbi:MAG: Xaa-Pro peptidase family protein [Paenibacillaceae bacterium]